MGKAGKTVSVWCEECGTYRAVRVIDGKGVCPVCGKEIKV
jgi:uncharacterized Zn finger protein (UPF0148 family)